jgi:hypothetical protein
VRRFGCRGAALARRTRSGDAARGRSELSCWIPDPEKKNGVPTETVGTPRVNQRQPRASIVGDDLPGAGELIVEGLGTVPPDDDRVVAAEEFVFDGRPVGGRRRLTTG